MKTWSDFAKVQPLAAKMLMNSFKKERLSHAYLIQGSRGTGKSTLAKLITMTLFCEELEDDVHPCFNCLSCKRIESGNHPDVHWMKPEGASIKNEQIDRLRKEFSYTSFEASHKVYVIEQSETMTMNAANRILKFLEEPDVKSTAILFTDNIQRMIPTIRSRCQLIDLQPLSADVFQQTLLEQNMAEMTEERARLLSSLTHNIDEAISLNEAGDVYRTAKLVKDLIQHILTKYEERYLFVHQQWLEQLKDKQEQQLSMELLLVALRDIVYNQLGSTQSLLFFQANDPLLSEATLRFPQQQLIDMIEKTLRAQQQLNTNVHPVLTMEQLVLQF